MCIRDRFGDLLYEEGCRKLLEAGPSTAIVTLGSRGSVGMTAQDGFFRTESFHVPVRDTTGAGDVFHGAYIVGLLEGMDAPECARFASAVSAIKCTCFGGRTGIPNRDTVQRLSLIHISYKKDSSGTGQRSFETEGFL